jgi:hypothetical protein
MTLSGRFGLVAGAGPFSVLPEIMALTVIKSKNPRDPIPRVIETAVDHSQ